MDINKMIADVKKHEGFISFMYADTQGKVTLGYGELLASAHDALALAPYLTFPGETPGHLPTAPDAVKERREKIESIWKAVHDEGAKKLHDSKGNVKKMPKASHYR